MDSPKIYSAICNAMSEIGAICKNERNKQQGFMYRGVDAVYSALQPVLIKNRIFVCPEVLEQTREDRTTSKGTNLIYSILKVRFTFYAEDGSSVAAVVTGEGMDSGDKASNKAMSVAFKYACFEVFCIPTEEPVDPDRYTPPPSYPVQDQPLVCAICGGEIKGIKHNGQIMTAQDVANKYGKCPACLRKGMEQ